ncbi:MAG: glycosyltransferase [Desulfobacteraceae bacterium]|nr:MAG: glycosyltransferase [Desulfobacteraceae bacterium]
MGQKFLSVTTNNCQKSFLHLKFNIFGYEDALKSIDAILTGTTFHSLFFVNAHCFNLSLKYSIYHEALINADLVFNDGIGMDFAARLIGTRFKHNLNGTDLIPAIIDRASFKKCKIYLLGGKPGVPEKAAENICKHCPDANIAGFHHGFFDPETEHLILAQIKEKKIDLLITAMGVPLQELWIWRNKDQLCNVKLAVAGGAILDFLSGNIKRAPLWMRRKKIEWLYRFYLEPNRMWRRYLAGNALFFWNLVRLKYQQNDNAPKPKTGR